MAKSIYEPVPVVERRIAYVPFGLVVALVLLRLATGFHFYREGTKKLTYNPDTKKIHIASVTEPFLRQAVGPVSNIVRERLPNVYNWERFLAVPRQSRPTTEEELAKRAEWETDYAKRRKEAATKKEPLPVEFPPHSPYYDWADRIVEGWTEAYDKFITIDGLSEEQKTAAATAFLFRRQQLADYFADESDAIAEWEHELWRLQELEKDEAGVSLPFLGARIDEKRAETKAASAAWISQVRDIEFTYKSDLRGLLTAEQEETTATAEAVDAALVDANAQKLHRLDVVVTCVVTGVGVLLMLGLFTRLAALVGIGFLLSVIATQPPWVPGAVTLVLYYQLVEIAALVVLFASAAGRYAGLDFIIRALFRRRAA